MTNKLTIDLEARIAQVLDSLDQIKRKSDQTTTAMAASFGALKATIGTVFAGLSVSMVTDAVKRVVADLSALDDAAEKVGGSVEDLSEIFNKWRVSGGTLDEMSGALARLVKSMQGADEESKGAGAAFELLGVKTRDAAGNLRPATTVMMELAQAFEAHTDSVEKTAYAQAIWGKSGADMLPKLRDLATETSNFGKVSAEQAANAEKLEKAFRRIGVASDLARQELLSNFIPALEKLATQFSIAQQAGMGFWQALGTIPYANYTKFEQIRDSLTKITKLEKELADEPQPNLVDLGERFFGKGRTRAQILQEQIADEQKRLTVLRSQVAAVIQNPMDDPAYPGDGKPKLKPLPKSGKDGKDNDPTKALEALAKEQVKVFIEAQKQIAKEQQAVLDFANSEGLKSIEDYFAERQDIAERAYMVERMALDQLVGEQTAAVEKQVKGSKEWAEAQKNLEETLGKRNQLDREFQAAGADALRDRAKATQEYADQTAALLAQLEAGRGNSAAAAVQAFDQQMRVLKARAEAGGDTVTAQAIADQRRQIELAAQYNDLAAKRAIIEEDLATRTARNQAAITTGAVTEIEGARRLSEIRQSAVPELEAIAVAQGKIAESLNSPRLQADVRAFKARTQELAEQADVLRDKYLSIGENAFSRLIDDAQSGTKTVGDLFKGMVRQILVDLAKVQFAGFGRNLMARLLGLGSGGGDVPFEFSGSGFADGGDPPVGKASLVGERGPELFVPKSAGTIIPNHRLGGNVNIVQNISVDSRSDVATIRAAMAQAERNAVAAVAAQIRNGNQAFA